MIAENWIFRFEIRKAIQYRGTARKKNLLQTDRLERVKQHGTITPPNCITHCQIHFRHGDL